MRNRADMTYKGNNPDESAPELGTQPEARRSRRDFLKSSGLLAASGVAAASAMKPASPSQAAEAGA